MLEEATSPRPEHRVNHGLDVAVIRGEHGRQHSVITEGQRHSVTELGVERLALNPVVQIAVIIFARGLDIDPRF